MKNVYRVAESNVVKKDWDTIKLKIALVFPNVYSGGMSGYTIQVLYELFNRNPDVLCERIFLPYDAMEKKYLTPNPGYELKPAYSLETHHKLCDFDWVAFSVHYELDYPYILWLLENSHIPILQSGRKNENWPLILIGGPAFRSNGLPLRNFIDCGFVGDLEPSWDVTLKLWFHISSQDLSYNEAKITFLQQISSINGWWSPHYSQNTNVSRVWLKNLDESPVKIPPILALFDPPESNPLTFGESILLEINRGCPHGCRFCMTGFQNRPFRNRSFSTIKNIINDHLTKSRLSHFTLIGASVTDHPEFLEICKYLQEKNCHFSIPSVRIDTITPEFAQLLQAGGMKTIAIAPEAGSDKLRQQLNKRLTNEQILNGCRVLKNSGIENLKLYLLFGLPFEQDSDLDAMVELVKKIAELGFNKWGIRLSLNPFIPKAHTPFEQSIEMYQDLKLKELSRRLLYLEKQFKPDSRIKFDSLNLEEALIQTIFSLGDESTGYLIETCYRAGVQFKKWYQSLKRELPLIESLWGHIKERSFGSQSWNMIQQGYNSHFLQQEWNRADMGKLGIECSDKCNACGCCPKNNEKI